MGWGYGDGLDEKLKKEKRKKRGEICRRGAGSSGKDESKKKGESWLERGIA